MKIRLGVFFGGQSVEHEVSIITAIQAMEAMDAEKYEIIPVYITKDDKFYTGEYMRDVAQFRDIPALLKKSVQVTVTSRNSLGVLERYPAKKFGDNTVAQFDLAFLAGHGTNVEDGALQGFFQLLGISHTGCDVCSGALAMNKYFSKLLLENAGIPVLPAMLLRVGEYVGDYANVIDKIESQFDYPIIVKPNNLGSSVGIKIAHDKDELISAVEHAFLFSRELIIERALQALREINVAVLGDCDEAIFSECEEPITGKEMLDFEEKYLRGGKGSKSTKGGGKSSGMASLSRKIPADITPEQRAKIQQYAVQAFQLLGCSGVARIDFMIDAQTDMIYLNELNTLPGSLAFYLWEAVGIKYNELIDRIVSLALKAKRDKQSVNFSFESNILSGYNPKSAKGKV